VSQPLTRTCVLLTLIISSGLIFRLVGLDSRTLTHPEAYVPRINTPEQVTSPIARHTLSAIFSSTVGQDNHPPGYYVFMWLWTALFGTGLFAIRLPSALLGTATIALLYVMARREKGPALTASALLAVNGHHTFWSQQARMWVPLTFLAVLSVVLLQSLHKRYRTVTAVIYMLTVSIGLWLDYYFWPFFLAQILWVFWQCTREKQVLITLNLQLLAVVLSSPVLLFLRYHIGAGGSWYLDTYQLGQFLSFAQLGGMIPTRVLSEQLGIATAVVVVFFVSVSFILLVCGIRAGYSVGTQVSCKTPPPLMPVAAHIVCGFLPFLFCLVFWGSLGYGRVRYGALLLPWILLLAWYMAKPLWPLLLNSCRTFLDLPVVRGLGNVVVVHFVAPVVLLAMISIFVPIIAHRGLLILTPFYLMILAMGLFALFSHNFLRSTVLTLLLLCGVLGVHLYSGIPTSPYDYQSLANAMKPLLKSQDTVFIENDWWAQPLHYYLKPDQVQTADMASVLADGFSVEKHTDGAGHLWAVFFDPSEPATKEMIQAIGRQLQGYQELNRVVALNVAAILYEPKQTRFGSPN